MAHSYDDDRMRRHTANRDEAAGGRGRGGDRGETAWRQDEGRYDEGRHDQGGRGRGWSAYGGGSEGRSRDDRGRRETGYQGGGYQGGGRDDQRGGRGEEMSADWDHYDRRDWRDPEPRGYGQKPWETGSGRNDEMGRHGDRGGAYGGNARFRNEGSWPAGMSQDTDHAYPPRADWSSAWGGEDRGGEMRGRGQAGGQDHNYNDWRARQMRQYDDDFAAFSAERQKKFDDEFDSWRKNRAATGQQDEDGHKSGSVTQASGRSGSEATGATSGAGGQQGTKAQAEGSPQGRSKT